MVSRKTMRWLLVGLALTLISGIPAASNPGKSVEYIGDLFDIFGATTLRGRALEDGSPIAGQRLWFEATNQVGVKYTSSSYLTNVLGIGYKPVNYIPNIYQLVTKLGDNVGPYLDSPISDPVVLTIFRPKSDGVYAGGKLMVNNYGMAPNVRRTIYPRNVAFGLLYEIGMNPWPQNALPWLPRGANEQFLLLDNYYPVADPENAGLIKEYIPVRVWASRFQNIKLIGPGHVHFWTRGWIKFADQDPKWRYLEIDIQAALAPWMPSLADVEVYQYPHDTLYRAKSAIYNGGAVVDLGP